METVKVIAEVIARIFLAGSATFVATIVLLLFIRGGKLTLHLNDR